MKPACLLWSWCAWCALALVGCSGVGLSTGDGSGGTTGASGSTTPASSAGAAAAQGVDCGVDPDTGATLCLGISTCPNLLIDSDAFPGCGFRVSGALLDLECSCTEELCPIGVATSCADAETLMMQQVSAGNVCAQVADGRCTGGMQAPAAAASTNACNQSCYDSCGGNPTCIAQCGC